MALPRLGKYRSDGSVSASFATCCSTLALSPQRRRAGTCVESFGCLRLPWKPELNHLIPALAAFRFNFLPRRAPAPLQLAVAPVPARPVSFHLVRPPVPFLPPDIAASRVRSSALTRTRACACQPVASLRPPSFPPNLQPGLPCHKASRTRATLALNPCAPELRTRVPSRRSALVALLTSLLRPCPPPSLLGLTPPPLRPNPPRPALEIAPPVFYSSRSKIFPASPEASSPRPIRLRGLPRHPARPAIVAVVFVPPPFAHPLFPALPACPYVSPGILHVLPNPSLAPPFVRAHLREYASVPAPHNSMMPLRSSSSSPSRRHQPAAHAGFLFKFAICYFLFAVCRSLFEFTIPRRLSTARRLEIPPSYSNCCIACISCCLDPSRLRPRSPVSCRDSWGLPILRLAALNSSLALFFRRCG
ncbi:hypothetical protein DFH09DRAFT_1447012 [Mycena vulgaris]|nr:hypothetical protein DFH09DRAFT_1447012 [Mycena vulgaris]